MRALQYSVQEDRWLSMQEKDQKRRGERRHEQRNLYQPEQNMEEPSIVTDDVPSPRFDATNE